MKFAKVENGVVVNVIELQNEDNADDFGVVNLGEDVAIGDTVDSDGNCANAQETARTKKSNDMKTLRNNLLTKTDKYGASDVVMSDAMRTYRQQLRDLTDDPDWPDVEIPTAPDNPLETQ